MEKDVTRVKTNEVKFVSQKSPDYRLEFVNGAFSSLTPRGEIICNFHLEYRDIPISQTAKVSDDGTAKLLPFEEAQNFTRDVKFGIVINAQLAIDLIKMLTDKVKEIEGDSKMKPKEVTH
ncbi:MAG TPA: hypothetical protein PLZ44_01920 [Methanothrix sp.]|nr:hypothetical protein [Methanothrix sp.]